MAKWLTIVLCLLLAGCGFQLRRELQLPANLQGLQVQTPDRYGLLQRDLERALQRAGAVPAADSKAQLRVPTAVIEQRPLSIGGTGRVQEYVIEYRAEFELIDAAGVTLIPLQMITLERDYSFDTAQSLGSPAEEAILRQELESAMAEAILRRVDAVLRGTR